MSERAPANQASRFDQRVATLVPEAAARSPGFRRRLAEAGLTAAEVCTVADLDRLPILSKDRLRDEQRAAPPFGGYLAEDARPVRVFQSPGPLYEPQLSESDPWRWAPALAAAGFRAGDVVLNAFGYHLSPAGAMFDAACARLGATVLPAGVGSKDLQVRAAYDLGATAYVGPPSYLKALYDAAADSGVRLRFDRAFVTAEPLPPSLRDWLAERVATLRQGYGTAETGLLAYECDARDGLHLSDDALVQIGDLDTGAARYDDGQGEVVVTLFDTGYPVVRFGTGDLSAWAAAPCTCGTATPRIRGWLGRVGDAVKVRGMFLHPAQVAAVLGRVPGVGGYHVVIDRVAHVDILRCEVVPATGAGERLADEVSAAIRDELRFRADVVVVEELPGERPVFDDLRQWE